MREKLEGHIQGSRVNISADDLESLLPFIHQLRLSRQAKNNHTPPTAQTPEQSSLQMKRKLMSQISVHLDVGRTEILLVGSPSEEEKENNSGDQLLLSFTSTDIRSEEMNAQTATEQEDAITLQIKELSVVDISGSTIDRDQTTPEFAIPIVSRNDIKLSVKMKRKGQINETSQGEQNMPSTLTATNMDLILAIKPNLNVVVSQQQLHILFSVLNVLRRHAVSFS